MSQEKAGVGIKSFEVSVSGSPLSLGDYAGGNLSVNRILLCQSAGGDCTVGDEIVQLGQIPLVATGFWLDLEVSDVGRVWVTGTGTVIVILEIAYD